jgi:O-antigen/teichoic acid export membrane protein
MKIDLILTIILNILLVIAIILFIIYHNSMSLYAWGLLGVITITVCFIDWYFSKEGVFKERNGREIV